MRSVFWRVAGVVLLLTFLWGCAISAGARRDRYLARGKAYLEKQDYSRAILEFKNAAAATPKDPEPYYQLGLGFLALRDPHSALSAFRKVLQLNPNHVQARLNIAQMKIDSNDSRLLKEAESQLGTVLKDAPSNVDALNALAVAQLKLSESETAIQTLDRALTEAPADVLASVLLARTKLARNDAQGAEDALKAACRNAPKSAEATLFLGELYLAQKRLPEGEAQFRQAVTQDHGNARALLDLARVELAEGKKPEAEQNAKRLSTFAAYKSAYGRFLLDGSRTDDAIREFERLVKENPSDRQLRSDLIVIYRSLNRTSDVDKLLDVALSKNPKDVDALLQRAQVLYDRKDYAKAEASLNYAVELRPTSWDVHYQLAKLKQARGAIRSYRQELSEALRLNPALEFARLELAHSLLADKAPKAALDLLDATPRAQKESMAILVQRNWALWFLGDAQEMRKGIDRGLSTQKSADLLVQDAAWKLRQRNPEAARSAAEQALKIDPSDVPALTILTETYQAERKSSIAVQQVREYAARQPNSAPVQDFFGDLLLVERQFSEGRAALLKAKTADPRFVKADLSLATVDAIEGKMDDARTRLLAVISADSGNSKARMMLANLDEIAGDKKAAIEQYRRVLDNSPENALALNNLAYLLTEYGNQPDEALKYAQQAVELSPDAPSYEDTLGWILYRKALYPQAVQYLERAAATNQERAAATNERVVWKYHLAMAYAKMGKLSRGRAILDEALKQNPDVPEAAVARQVVSAR
jgi:tetratricopeptide (TPR) repeat protein